MPAPAVQPPLRPLPLPWRLVEAFFARLYQLTILDADPDSLIAYGVYTYRGPVVHLQDGTIIRTGDRVLEVHFRREALVPRTRGCHTARLAVLLLQLADRDVPRLARRLAEDPALREVRAAHALTLFHRGIRRYGFEVHPMVDPAQPPPGRWLARAAETWMTAWHRLLLARDHPQGRERVRGRGEVLVTRHVWVSRQALLRRYGCALPEPCSSETRRECGNSSGSSRGST